MTKKRTHELSLTLHRETEKGLLVSETGDAKQGVWLPKSQISWQENPTGFDIVAEVPEWLCREKGFSGF